MEPRGISDPEFDAPGFGVHRGDQCVAGDSAVALGDRGRGLFCGSAASEQNRRADYTRALYAGGIGPAVREDRQADGANGLELCVGAVCGAHVVALVAVPAAAILVYAVARTFQRSVAREHR